MISLLVALCFSQLRNMLNLNRLNDQHLIALTCLQWALTQFPSPKPFFFPSKPLSQGWEHINITSLWIFSLTFQALSALTVPAHSWSFPNILMTQNPMSAFRGHQPPTQEHLRWICPHLSCSHRPGWSWLPGLTLALHYLYGLAGAGPAVPLTALLLSWGWWERPWLPNPPRTHEFPSIRQLPALTAPWHWLPSKSFRETEY